MIERARGWLFVATTLLACGPRPGPHHSPTKAPGPVGPPAFAPLVYSIVTDRSAEVLSVTATIPPGLSADFGTDDTSARYVDEVSIDGARVPFRDGRAGHERCKDKGCTLRFRYRLAAAGRAMREPDYAMEARGAFFTTPSTFLLRPLEEHAGRYRITVSGAPFVASLSPTDDGYEGDLLDLAATGYVGFGDLATQEIRVGQSVIVVAMDRGVQVERQAAVVAWVQAQAEAVAKLYGAFPVRRAAVFIDSVRGRDVVFGKTLGHGAASIVVMVGQNAKPDTLRRDWVLNHELVHLAMPALPLHQRWFEEGVATYIEPAVRAEAGLSTVEDAWDRLQNGMRHGLPRAGDEGLDHTDTWGRRYWGGALFCLEADLALRRETKNKLGLRDALRAIRETHGGITERNELSTLLRAADEKLGVKVLGPLYDRWAHGPVMVDLDRTWTYLGVVKSGDSVSLRADAEGAAFRQGIIRAAPGSFSGTGDGRTVRMEKTNSGLQYEDTVVGTGASPNRGQTCEMHYTGWLFEGGQKTKKFDSSHDRGRPFTFQIGIGRVIAGWDEGVATMKVGGKRTLLIPPDLGYGARGAGGAIPPNATLWFEVELLGIQ